MHYFSLMKNIHDLSRMRSRKFVFRDREHGGDILAEMLFPAYGEREDTMVIGIPSGGVPVAVRIAVALKLPMDLLIVRKLPVPGNPEAGFGAITLSGEMFLNDPLIYKLRLTPGQIEEQAVRVKKELERRNRLFRHGRIAPVVSDRTVIVVDDGLASGFTMMAALRDLEKAGAARLVVAAPTGSENSIERLARSVHEIYCPNIRSGTYFAVAEAYRSWYDLYEDEVLALLGEFREAGGETDQESR